MSTEITRDCTPAETAVRNDIDRAQQFANQYLERSSFRPSKAKEYVVRVQDEVKKLSTHVQAALDAMEDPTNKDLFRKAWNTEEAGFEAWIEEYLEKVDHGIQDVNMHSVEMQAADEAIKSIYEQAIKTLKKLIATLKTPDLTPHTVHYCKTQLDGLADDAEKKLKVLYDQKNKLVPKNRKDFIKAYNDQVGDLVELAMEAEILALQLLKSSPDLGHDNILSETGLDSQTQSQTMRDQAQGPQDENTGVILSVQSSGAAANHPNPGAGDAGVPQQKEVPPPQSTELQGTSVVATSPNDIRAGVTPSHQTTEQTQSTLVAGSLTPSSQQTPAAPPAPPVIGVIPPTPPVQEQIPPVQQQAPPVQQHPPPHIQQPQAAPVQQHYSPAAPVQQQQPPAPPPQSQLPASHTGAILKNTHIQHPDNVIPPPLLSPVPVLPPNLVSANQDNRDGFRVSSLAGELNGSRLSLTSSTSAGIIPPTIPPNTNLMNQAQVNPPSFPDNRDGSRVSSLVTEVNGFRLTLPSDTSAEAMNHMITGVAPIIQPNAMISGNAPIIPQHQPQNQFPFAQAQSGVSVPPMANRDGFRVSSLAGEFNGSRLSLASSTAVGPAPYLQRQSTLISQAQPISSILPQASSHSFLPGTIPTSLAVSQMYQPASIPQYWQNTSAAYPHVQLPPVQTQLPYPSYQSSQSSNTSFLHGGPLFQPPPLPVYNSALRSYKRRDPPKFSGDILKFPQWFYEWRYVIAPSGLYGERELIHLLDEHTPSSIHLAHNDTLEQCWFDLISRYANASAITSKVIKELTDFKPSSSWSDHVKLIKLEAIVTKTLRSLKCVDKTSQLTDSDAMLTHSMQCLPPSHHDQVVSLQYMNSLNPPHLQVSKWDVFYRYLKDKKASLEQFGTHTMEEVEKQQSRFCKKCNKRHEGSCNHVSAEPVVNHQHQQQASSSNQKPPSAMEKLWQEWGSCPVCGKKGHMFTGRGNRKLASSRLYDCGKWRSMSLEDQVKQLEKVKGCKICTSWLHNHHKCDARTKTCGHQDNGQTCNQPHNKMFHGCKIS